jgi:DNA-binding Lrp family transcriptional regulator
MDKFDYQIIEILKHGARTSVSDIARQVSLSRTAVTARIQKLECEGVILGYHANIALDEQQGEPIRAYLALKFDTTNARHHCEAYSKDIYHIRGVKHCHSISGETDMMLYVEADSMSHLNTIINELQQFPELRHLITHTVLAEHF